MANEDKKNFNAMLHDKKDMPKIQIITDQKSIEKYGGSKMYFAPPIDYDKVMKKIPYEMLEDLRLTNEYKAIKLFNYKSDNFSESIEQCRDSFIVVDNADNLINDEVRRFINFEPSNQYMLFLRNCDGLNVSDKSFKVLKFDNNRITLEEEL